MNLERQLDLNVTRAVGIANEYYEDPELMMSEDFDQEEFFKAMNQKSVAVWAQNLQIKNSYGGAKKILDTI